MFGNTFTGEDDEPESIIDWEERMKNDDSTTTPPAMNAASSTPPMNEPGRIIDITGPTYLPAGAYAGYKLPSRSAPVTANAGTEDSQSKLIEALKVALQDALGFAELIEALAKPDVEIYKHELRSDSERAQQRINTALQAIEDSPVGQGSAKPSDAETMLAMRAESDRQHAAASGTLTGRAAPVGKGSGNQCGTCDGNGVVGSPPDQYFDCPECAAAQDQGSATSGEAAEFPMMLNREAFTSDLCFESYKSELRSALAASADHYAKAVAVLNQLLDAGGADEDHPLAGLVNTVGLLISAYQDAHNAPGKVAPAAPEVALPAASPAASQPAAQAS